MWIIKIIKIKCFPRILDEHWCIYSCLQNPPRENRFQYVRRVYATAINFPCISTSWYVLYVWLKNYFYSLLSLITSGLSRASFLSFTAFISFFLGPRGIPNTLSRYSKVVVVFINTIKTTFDFNFWFLPSFITTQVSA